MNKIKAILNFLFGCFVPFRKIKNVKHSRCLSRIFNFLYSSATLVAVLVLVFYNQYGVAILAFCAFWGVGAFILNGPKGVAESLRTLSRKLGGRPRKDIFPAVGSPFTSRDIENRVNQIMSEFPKELETDDAVAIAKILTSNEYRNRGLLKGNYKQGDMALWLYRQNIELFKNKTAADDTLKSNSPLDFKVDAWREILSEILTSLGQ